MASTIPADLKDAYAKLKKAEGTVTKERAKAVTISGKLADQKEVVAVAHDIFVVAREDVRTLERAYDIGDWAPSDVPPTVIGEQVEEI